VLSYMWPTSPLVRAAERPITAQFYQVGVLFAKFCTIGGEAEGAKDDRR
jgi:hypothetical protein